jgi:peptidoglycan hydrolase CwlO-like protein
MRRRLSEEDMRESYYDAYEQNMSLHSVLSERQKMELNKIYNDDNDIKILKSQTEELQGQLQEAYKRIKLLREEIIELKKLIPIKQLEFKF